MREYHNRRAARARLQVFLQPRQLLIAEKPKAAATQIQHIGQADKMHPVLVEAVPLRGRGFGEALEIRTAVIDEHVVFARYVVHVEPGAPDDLRGGVELVGLGQVADVAGMYDELVFLRARADLVDGFLQGARRVEVRVLAEADVTVADLHEAERMTVDFGRLRSPAYQLRPWHAAAHCPQHADTGPCHARQCSTPSGAVVRERFGWEDFFVE